MRMEVLRADLTRVLTAITRVVEAKSHIPILSNVVMTAADGILTARGTDLDVEITVTTPCTVTTPGVACVPARNLADIVKRMAGDTVSLELELGVVPETGNLIVKSGRSRFKLPSVPSRSFPSLSVTSYDHSFTANLSALFAPVMFAVAADRPDYHSLEGVYMHQHGDVLRAVGADGPRMAIYAAPLPEGAAGMAGAIVPPKVAALASAFKAPIDISLCNKRILLRTADTVICAKLIEGTYPEYNRHIPTTHGRTVVADKAELASAAGRVGVVAAESTGKAIRLNIAPGSIQLVASDRDGREAVDEIAVQYEGEPTFVAFNVRYLDDMLAAVPGASVEFDITDNTTTTRVRSTSDEAFIGVMTPFRV